MRIKRGKAKRQKHNKILKLAKGYRLSYSKSYRRATEASLHAGQYNFNDRKKRQNKFRQTWIKRINAALSNHDMKYNEFISALKASKIELDRKVLAGLALDYPETFEKVVSSVKK